MVLQVRTTIGDTGDEHACDGPDVVQTNDLRDKTGNLVSDLKISFERRGNIYALEVHTNIFFSNRSGLTVLEKDKTFLFRSRGFTDM